MHVSIVVQRHWQPEFYKLVFSFFFFFFKFWVSYSWIENLLGIFNEWKMILLFFCLNISFYWILSRYSLWKRSSEETIIIYNNFKFKFFSLSLFACNLITCLSLFKHNGISSDANKEWKIINIFCMFCLWVPNSESYQFE